MRSHETFSDLENYHVFNRGAHKLPIFTKREDYDRFLLLLFCLNRGDPVVMRDLLQKYRGETSVIFKELPRAGQLVNVLAYSLMPNHFHLILSQAREGGITTFMRKVLTSYTMYFNTKYDHSGVVFQGAFKSKHIDSEPYFRWIYSYVHLNPIDLVEPNWKEAGIRNPKKIRQHISTY